jgi:hypothetical protein
MMKRFSLFNSVAVTCLASPGFLVLWVAIGITGCNATSNPSVETGSGSAPVNVPTVAQPSYSVSPPQQPSSIDQESSQSKNQTRKSDLQSDILKQQMYTNTTIRDSQDQLNHSKSKSFGTGN